MASTRTLLGPFPVTGGLDLKTDPSQIGDSESAEALNGYYDVQGIYRKRDGYTRFNGQAISSAGIDGVYRLYQSNGNKFLLAVSNGKFWEGTDAGGLWTALAGVTPTMGLDVFWATAQDLAIGANGATAPWKFSATATAAALGGTPPTFTIPFLHKGYLFGGRVSGALSQVSYSALNNVESWPATNKFTVRANDGSNVTQLGSLIDVLHIFKDRSVHAAVGSVFDPVTGDFQVGPVTTEFGCIASKSLVNTGSAYIFLAHDGLRIMDASGHSQILSGRVESELRNIPKARRTACAGVWVPQKQLYLFAYTAPSDLPANTNQRVLVYDFRLGTWASIWTGHTVRCFAQLSGSADFDFTVSGSDSDGYVQQTIQRDARRSDFEAEKVISTFETGETWVLGGVGGGLENTTTFKEGTQSRSLSAYANLDTMTRTVALDLSSFPDGRASDDTNDLIHLVTNHVLRANIVSFELWFDVNTGDFATDVLKVTVLQAALTAGDNQWTTHNLAKSSFTRTGSTAGKGWSTVTKIQVRLTTSGGVGTMMFDDWRLVSALKMPILCRWKGKRHLLAGGQTDARVPVVTVTDVARGSDLVITALVAARRSNRVGSVSKTIVGGGEFFYTAYLDPGGAGTGEVVKWRKSSGTRVASLAIGGRYLTTDGVDLWQTITGVVRITVATMTQAAINSAGTVQGSGIAVEGDEAWVYSTSPTLPGLSRYRKTDLLLRSRLGTGPLSATSPANGGLVLSPVDYYYVQGHAVLRVSRADGTTKAMHGSLTNSGAGTGDLNLSVAQTGLALEGDRLYVADTRNNRVKVLDAITLAVRAIWLYGDQVFGLGLDDRYLYVLNPAVAGNAHNVRLVNKLTGETVRTLVITNAIVATDPPIYLAVAPTSESPRVSRMPTRLTGVSVQLAMENNNRSEILALAGYQIEKQVKAAR